MSRELVESIISNNMLEANDMVEAKLAEIREKKIYEMKRMFAAKMHEGVGGLTKAEVEARKKAGYRKASEVLGDPRETSKIKPVHKFTPVKKGKVKHKAPSLDIDMSKEKRIGESVDPYEGKGNAPWTMMARGLHKAKKAIADHKPDAPGTKRVKAAGTVAKAIGNVGRELGSIGFSNLE